MGCSFREYLCNVTTAVTVGNTGTSATREMNRMVRLLGAYTDKCLVSFQMPLEETGNEAKNIHKLIFNLHVHHPPASS